MRKYNYAYFITRNGEPRDIGVKLLGRCNKLPKFEKLQKDLVKEIRKGQQYNLALPIDSEYKENLRETTRNIKLAIYSLHSTAEKLNLKSISIAKSPHVNHVLWEEILATLRIAFLNSSIKIIICIGMTQYPMKEGINRLIDGAHSSAVGGHRGVTETYSRSRQRYYW